MVIELGLRRDDVARRLEEEPFRILVLGNFSGHAAGIAAQKPLAERRIAAVDFERLDGLWALFSPGLQLELGGTSITFAPRDLDDFHPDHLYQVLPVFEKLRATRKALLDPKTAQQTLDELMASGAMEAAAAGAAQDGSAEEIAGETSSEDAGDMFERLLGKSSPSRDKPKSSSPTQPRLEGFIRQLVAPHIVDDPDPRVETAVDSIDLATSDLMRSLLHDPDFQALEAAWRSLHEMVARIELDETLQLFACNVRRDELLMGLPEPGANLADSALFELLVKRREAVDDAPWTVIVGDDSFGHSGEDIALLTALGAAAAANGGIFLGAASLAMLGCERIEDLPDTRNWSRPPDDSLWNALRESDVADRIGLALPRVLARLPYGSQTEPVDRFEFEEMPHHDHAAYLWANPAFSCATLLAEGFTREGWRMAPGGHVELGALPAHTFEAAGETRLKPCTEVLIPEATMVAILERGLMPLVSYRDRNTAVVGRFQSIASPAAPLNGPWTR